MQAKVTAEHPNSQTLSTRDQKHLHSEWSLHTKIRACVNLPASQCSFQKTSPRRSFSPNSEHNGHDLADSVHSHTMQIKGSNYVAEGTVVDASPF